MSAIAALTLLSWLPVDLSSAICGKLARIFGPLGRRHARADRALKHFFPHLSADERRQMLAAMWDNIGRVFGEFPHIHRIVRDPERFRIEGVSETSPGVREGTGMVVITGHFGNWELAPGAALRFNRQQANFYRPIDDPLLDRYVRRQRERISTEMIAKGTRGVAYALKALKRGYFVGMLSDQRESDGIILPFLGEDALTNHGPAVLALRANVPIFAGVAFREKGARFRMICSRLEVDLTGDRSADVVTLTCRMNELFETWLREHPEQWLWTHDRWKYHLTLS